MAGIALTDVPQFADRREAGCLLALALERFRQDEPVVLALPRGGVPVAYEVAAALDAPLDVVIVRKIGAPGQPEFGIGAMVDGDEPQVVLNPEAVRAVHASQQYIQAEQAKQRAEIERRRQIYRRGRAPLVVGGRTALVVDDGVATGSTVRAVLKALSLLGAKKVVLAIPVGPKSVLTELGKLADEVVCLATPVPFHAVGQHYTDFGQTSDEEVTALLDRRYAAARQRGSSMRRHGVHPV